MRLVSFVALASLALSGGARAEERATPKCRTDEYKKMQKAMKDYCRKTNPKNDNCQDLAKAFRKCDRHLKFVDDGQGGWRAVIDTYEQYGMAAHLVPADGEWSVTELAGLDQRAPAQPPQPPKAAPGDTPPILPPGPPPPVK